MLNLREVSGATAGLRRQPRLDRGPRLPAIRLRPQETLLSREEFRMKSTSKLRLLTTAGITFAAVLALNVSAWAAGPEIVAGPAADPKCYVPWAEKTKFFKYPAKSGPYRIALANGFIANTWRIQMIKTAKAYAAQADVTAKLKEFKVVSTGEDVAAQIAAINNFIDSGYDA